VKAWADGESLGSWARSLFRAPMTRPGDPAERAAEQTDDAAAKTSRAPATDTGTPPWGGGRPLSPAERRAHEPRFGTHLRDVRVHEGPAPARWARALGARAFSVGRDVVLGEGARDTRVMAHELAHVVAGRGLATPVIARVALSAADYDALADSLHDAVTSATADEELIYVALQKLERDATAVTALRTAYRTRHTTELVTALRGRLTGRRLNLALTLLNVPLPSGTPSPVAAAPPRTAAQYEAVARAVHTALVATPANSEAVYAALLPLGRDLARVTTLRSTYLTLFPTATSLEAHIVSILTGTDAAYALYLLNAPGPATPHTPANIPARPGAGTSPATAPPAVTGGTVSIGTQTPYTTTRGSSATFSFGVGYSGGLSADTRMLQFIWREIIVTNAAGVTAPLAGTVTTTGVPYALTTTPATPTRRVDSNNATTPFYDESHSSSTFRDATSVAIYDAPSPIRSMVSAQFAAGATRAVSREHFDIFLIRDFSTIYHVVIVVEHVATSATASSTNRRVVSAATATSLPTDMRTVLLARYPSFAYIA
jgi:hypothetical protein